MSEESNSVDFSQYEPQLERWLRKIREEIKVSTIDDLQVLTHQLASEFKKIKKRIENIEKEIAKIKKNLGESE
jgi:uncharacterized protein YPO0396